jgi:long-chain fatty acid transport protein
MNSRTWWVAGLVALGSSTAQAGGLYLPTRGVRPTARGGAFVAGGDDPGAMWFNPAGLAALAGGRDRASLLVDSALVFHSVEYTRIDSGGVTQPTVQDDPQLVPIPTIAAGFDLGKKMVLGVGLFAPYSGLDGYPEDGAQRYSLVSLHGTLISMLQVALAARVGDSLWLGAGVENMFLTFRSRVVFSACPREVVCAPEDPEFDSPSEIEWNDPFNPSAILGAVWQASRTVKVGASFQLPFWLSGEATVRSRLPTSGFFQGAHVEGDKANVSMTLPAALRVGVELAPRPSLRVELGADLELWSQHDEIAVEPIDVRIEDTPGVGVYDLGPFSIPRRMNNTFAVRLGAEQRFGALALRGGYTFETGAAPDEYLSVMTVDSNKHMFAGGLGWESGRLRVDATAAYVLVGSRDVAAGTSCAPQSNPVRSGQDPQMAAACVHDGSPDHVYVGDGHYTSSWLVLGLGAQFGF